ncbi:MAG: hypothetical protein IKJ70_05200 [Clostridia bacterium]|nr:hypothetical protein [Clostridia bacterium]
MKKILAITLSVIMIFSCSAIPAFAADTGEFDMKNSLNRFLGTVVETLIGAVDFCLGENKSFVREDEFVYDNFYEGTAEFIEEAKEGAKWSLGYSSESLVPENFEDYDLYLGGFMCEKNMFTNDVREVLDDMKVRVIALNDGSGRGTSVFATVDSIGVSNGDIRHIRGLLDTYAKENGLNSINIFATHVHSGIDTQGMWTEIIKKWPRNILTSALRLSKYQLQGTDPEYMEFFYGKIKGAIEKAVSSMEEGEMTFARKDIGERYFNNKNRPSASAMDTELKRFTFTPDNKEVTPTIILNMAAHPDVAGLAVGDEVNGHGISGDYVYYIGETLNKAGYNFMFFNGAICGIYIGEIKAEAERRVDKPANYGREIGRMVLSLTKTEEEIKSDPFLSTPDFKVEDEYIVWYEGWTPTTETKVEPILNIRLSKVDIKVQNPLIRAASKIKLVNYLVKVKGFRDYYLTTEIGYIEMGKDIKIAMVPGELCTDLAYGGTSLKAENSISGKDFEGKTLVDIFGEDVIVFGLANDTIGYIVPDNDYVMLLNHDHYAETLSVGKHTASTLMSAFESLAK